MKTDSLSGIVVVIKTVKNKSKILSPQQRNIIAEDLIQSVLGRPRKRDEI